VAAAMGIALGVRDSKAETVGDLKRDLDLICDNMSKTRPTAVNLFWAIRRMQEKFERLRVRPIAQIKQELVEESSACTPKISPLTRPWDATAPR